MPDALEAATSAVSAFAAPSGKFTGVNRDSGTLADRPAAKLEVGGFYFATDVGVKGTVYQSNGREWLPRGNLDRSDVAGQMSGLEADRPPAAKCIGWTYHATDTNIDYEAFPNDGDGVWFTLSNPNQLAPENLLDTVSQLSGPGFAKLRSLMSGQFGIRLQSTGDAASLNPVSQIVMQTLDVSSKNPCVVDFDQFIFTPFTGAGQFDLVEHDASDADLFDADGQAVGGVTIATKDGFTDVESVGGWSRFSKAITSDKIYSLVGVPGSAGDGIFSIRPRTLIPLDPDQTPLPS